MRAILAVVAVTLVPAIGHAQGTSIKRTNPPEISKPTGYTHVVEVTGPVKTIYVAGQVALDKDGKVVGAGDMKAQAEQAFKNVESALAAAGAKFPDVVKMNVYVTDISQAPAVRDVRTKYFGTTVPASTLVQVVALARPEFLIEVEVVAAVAGR